MNPSEDVDWERVTRATYRIEQTLRYEYPCPIADLRHRLVVVPRIAHGDQRRLSRELTASPAAPVELRTDPFGNEIAHVRLDRVDGSLTFRLAAIVERSTEGGDLLAETTARPALYLEDRRLIRPDERLAEVGAELRRRHPEPHERAAAIVRYVYRQLTYTRDVTDVFTTAAVAFRMGRGVCQDYAHVTIALARAAHVTARYVSGHMIGESATHAWVEFLLPQADGTVLVESYDPTQGARTSLRYVTIAVGRDYDDVAPTSGVFTGRCTGTLRGTQRVVLLDAEAA